MDEELVQGEEEEEDFDREERSNSPVCIEQLDTSSRDISEQDKSKQEEVKKEDNLEKEELQEEEKEEVESCEQVDSINSDQESPLEEKESTHLSTDSVGGVEIVEEPQLSESEEDYNRRLSQEGRVSFLEETSEVCDPVVEVDIDQISIRNRVTEVEEYQEEDQLSDEFDEPTVESPKEEEKQYPQQEQSANAQEHIVELEDIQRAKSPINSHKSVSFEKSPSENNDHLEKENKKEPSPQIAPIVVPTTNSSVKSVEPKQENKPSLTPKDHLTKKPEEEQRASNLDFLFPDISSLCMKVNK